MGVKRIAADVAALVEEKDTAYGASFDRAGDVLRVLYPGGVKVEQYDDLLAVVRIVDKLFRIANGSQGTESPYLDIVGYGLLGERRARRG